MTILRARTAMLASLTFASACAELVGIREGEPIEDAFAPDGHLGPDALDPDAGAADGQPATDAGAQVARIAAGGKHTCVVLQGGGLRCWGDNEFGQLGLKDRLSRGKTPESMADTTVDLGAQWRTAFLSLGRQQSCAVSEGTGPDARLKCWGRLGPTTGVDGGQLDAGASASPPPTGDAIAVLATSVTAVGTGATHTCAVANGVTCWNLAAGFARPSSPQRVSALAAGNGYTCELFFADAGARCWEAAPGAPIKNVDLVFPAGATVEAITSRVGHACAVLSDGSLGCWGIATLGAVTPGDAPDGSAVAALSFDEPVVAASAGARHSCVVLKSGVVKCWGDNTSGQLGLVGPTTTKGEGFTATTLPAVDVGLATDIAAGDAHTCALLRDGTVTCWGANEDGQLGIGDQRSNTLGKKPSELPRVRL